MLLYGESGTGKSSLVNAGLLPHAVTQGLEPVRVRVQPRPGEELVVERIAISEDGDELLPCVITPEGEPARRVVLSIAAFEERVHGASAEHRPLIVFDQFEEILTLFETADASRRALAEMIVRLGRDPVPIKLVFAFREDYLGRVTQLLRGRPELVDQALRLGPPAAAALPAIIRGPFDAFPGHFEPELDAELAERLRAALAERFGTGEMSLSEVQTVCIRLWRSADPMAMLDAKGVQGLLEDELNQALNAFTPPLRGAAIALLSQMVTSAGTRNVISAEDLRRRVHEADDKIPVALVDEALERLERDSALVRRERRRDLDLYEITSEFLVPWIRRRREELRRAHERRRERRRLRILASIAGALLVVLATVATLAVVAFRERVEAQAIALSSSATALLEDRPDISLLLALEANRVEPWLLTVRSSAEIKARSSALAALTNVRGAGVVGFFHGHTDVVRSVAVSPDGRTLASAAGDDTMRFWDIRSHERVDLRLPGMTAAFAVAFSGDGRTLASAGHDGAIRLWDLRTRRMVRRLPGHEQGSLRSVALSHDGNVVASAGMDKRILAWDARAPDVPIVTSTPAGDTVAGDTVAGDAVAVSPDGRTVAGVGRDGVLLWEVRTNSPPHLLRTGRGETIRALAFSPDGGTLAAGAADGTVRLWSARSRKLLRALPAGDDDIRSVAFSPDGRTLASAGADKTIRLWKVGTGKSQGSALRGHADIVRSVAFGAHGRIVISGSNDATIRAWAVNDRNGLGARLSGEGASRVAFSSSRRLLATSERDTVHTWDPTTASTMPLARGPSGDVANVALSGDGGVLAYKHNDGTGCGAQPRTSLRLRNARTGAWLGTLPGHCGAVSSAAFSHDGRMLVSAGGDDTIRLWDVRTREQTAMSRHAPRGGVRAMALSRNGRLLATAGKDKRIYLWDAKTLARRPGDTLRGHNDLVNSIAFSPDGKTLASGGNDDYVRLWDLNGRKHESLIGHDDDVRSVVFSADGTTLASAGDDKTIRLWNVAAGTPFGAPLTGHGKAIHSVAFSPDQRSLASAGADGTWLWKDILWRTDTQLTRMVCALVGTSLSEDTWKRYGQGDHPRRCR